MARKATPPVPEVATIGGRLRRLRKQCGLTQSELARQIGIQQSDLSRMEKGEYRVSLDNLFKILAAFDVEVTAFFGAGERQPQPMQRPLSQLDMQTLHLLRQLSDDGRQDVMEFIEFKLRREHQDRRAIEMRRTTDRNGR